MNAKSGQRELLPNVFASGIAYLVGAAIGFIMPRIIYDSVGPIALGLWDLGWSFLLYSSFPGIGFGPALVLRTVGIPAVCGYRVIKKKMRH